MMTTTYSQAGQDLFVITMFQGKHNGTFLEIGCGPPIIGNNTFLLEEQYNYTGTSIDVQYYEWDRLRPKGPFVQADAIGFDYSTLASYYDYLQIDIDPSMYNYYMLDKLIPNKTFGVITFEHDVWDGTDDSLFVQQESRKFFAQHGYELLVDNVTIEPGKGFSHNNKPIFFEDWYVNPSIIPQEIINKYKWVDYSNQPKYYTDILSK